MAESTRGRVPRREAGADRLVVVVMPGNAGGAKRPGHPGVLAGQPREREEPAGAPKPFEISKNLVWEAWKRVRSNGGSAGADGVTIEQYEQNLTGELYKLWNRMSSGSYMPAPVLMVDIPKTSGGVRTLSIPTVADRIAQTAAKMVLEPCMEPVMHPDSYGYRPGRSALDAVGRCRERCWRSDWVIDLDIESFFDSVDRNFLMKAVGHHTDSRWVLLYVQRWLNAPLISADHGPATRAHGIPQGSPLSPLLANIYLHYAFDAWMEREFPGVRFERYCDDAIVHCASERDAENIRAAIADRLAGVGLRLNEAKTHIVYCKDSDRRGRFPLTRFDFLGYTFRPRLSRNRFGKTFVNFTPAVSDRAAKSMRREIRRWRLHSRSDKTLDDLARMFNIVIQGWINYYGRYYKSMLYPTFRHLNEILVRWAMKKFKRLHRHERRARQFLAGIGRRQPDLFAHGRFGVRPSAG